jgi:ABC-type nitrate/sulfonate/bicarbonate transport system permease component
VTRRILNAFNLLGCLVTLAVIGLWQLVVESGLLEFDYLPPPTDVFDALSHLIGSGEMGSAVGHTLRATLLASAIAIVLGAMLGAAVGLLSLVERFFMATFDVLRTVPVVALMPVALLVWGPAAKTEIIVAVYAATWPMLVNAAGGVRAVHPRLRDVARTFRLSKRRTFTKIILPAAMPALLVGARLSVVTALVVTIVAEMLVNSEGLGWALIQSQDALQPAQMWAYAVVCGIIGYLLNVALMQLVRLGLPGGAAAMGVGGSGS